MAFSVIRLGSTYLIRCLQRLLPAVADKPEDEDAPDRAQEPEYEDPAERVTASFSSHFYRKADPKMDEQ